MKKLLLLFFLLFYSFGYSQISVSHNHNRKSKKLDEELLDRFKKSTTIFVLPETISKKDYEIILKKYWKTTPYKLVSFIDFDFKKYDANKFSFAYVHTTIKTIDKSRAVNVYIYANLDIFMLNASIKKNTSTNWLDYKIDLVRIPLFPKNEYLKKIANNRNSKNLKKLIYKEHVFYNFTTGFFKNYIQKTQQLLKDKISGEKESYYLYENDHLQEIKTLSSKKLYVPEYVGLKFNSLRETNSGKGKEHIHDIFKSYEFDFEIIKNDALNDLILSDKHFYYLKFTRINTQRFLTVVNAFTGEIVYRKYIPGIAYNLNTNHILKLNNTIKADN